MCYYKKLIYKLFFIESIKNSVLVSNYISKMNTNNLRKGHRYLFYVKEKAFYSKKIFRANLVAIYRQSLVVNSSETEPNPKTQISIPLGWITKIETLEDITCGKSILPEEILLMIDEYV